MRTKNKRNQEERRTNTRRKEERRENTRGIIDRRGSMERRNQNRRIEDKEEKIIKDLEKIFEDQIEGRNAVLELLESDKDINKIYITKGELKGSINKIIAKANEKKSNNSAKRQKANGHDGTNRKLSRCNSSSSAI